MAGLATVLFVSWGLNGLRVDRPPATTLRGWWRAVLVLGLLLVAWRWPFWFDPAGFNPDESLLVAGALTLTHDPVFWRSVDGATAGPLNFYVLLGAHLIGAPVTLFATRLTGLLLIFGTLVFAYGLLRLFLARAPARLTLLPGAVFFAIVTQDDFVHYSTEHLSLFLFSGAAFLLVRRQLTGAGGTAAWWAGGIALGLLPWAKLQSMPLGAALVVWLTLALWRNPARSVAEKRRSALNLLLAGLAPNVLAIGLIYGAGVWPYFWQAYVLQNFHYVAADTTWTYLWQTATRSLNLTWHFQACMAAPLLIALAGSLRRRRAAPDLWLLGFLLCLAAIAAVIIPRRPFAHYLLFLILPLLWWSGATIGLWWDRSRSHRRIVLITCLTLGGLLPLALRFSQPAPEMVDRLVETRVRPYTAAGSVLRACAQPGDRLGIWGWMCDFYLEANLPQATRQAASPLCILPSSQRDYYRHIYLTDLRQNRPALFLDAVGPTADLFQDRTGSAHEIFPELAAFVREHYTEIIDLEYARLYVRNDRAQTMRLDAATLRELTTNVRNVRGRPAPEPVDIAQPHLPQNVIGGRVVRMMLSPAEIAWTLRGTERKFHFEIGYDPRAYIEGDGNGTLFTAELATPSGAVYPIHSRLLDPVNRSADRGFVHAHFLLPPVPAGSRLVLRTSPGPAEDARWDWAFLASAAFDHSPLYASTQFPGFNRVPDIVTADVTYLETEVSRPVLALHAPAALLFRLHGGERSVAFDFGFREGAYRHGGNTDGAAFRLALRRPGQPDVVVFERLLQPVRQVADEGLQHVNAPLPDGLLAGTGLVVEITPGPNQSPDWDWTWLSSLQIH